MIPLPISFSKDRFSFHQLQRKGQVALLEKSKGRYKGWEVVVVRQRNGFGCGEQQIPAREWMPGSNEWGRLGWTYSGYPRAYQDAQERFQKEVAKRSPKGGDATLTHLDHQNA